MPLHTTRRSMLLGLAAAPLWPALGRAQAPLSGVATTGMIADTARALGGPGVQVGKGIADVGNGIEDGTQKLAKAAKNAGEWKS